MIGTVIRQTVSNGDIVTFVEGDLGASTWTPQINQIYDGAVSFLSPDCITDKTVSGFTLVGLLATVEIYGIVSDAGGTEETDPDLNANAIVTLNDVKSYLKYTSADVSHDAFLKAAINRVSDTIEASLRSKVKLQSLTGFILDGSGSYKQLLPAECRPIYQIGVTTAAVTDIQYRDTPIGTWTNLLDNIAYAQLHQTERYYIALYNAAFPLGFQNVLLNCKAGYSTVPGKIIMVCIEAVTEIFKESNRGLSRLGVSSVSGNQEGFGGNISFKELSERHYEALAPWRYLA